MTSVKALTNFENPAIFSIAWESQKIKNIDVNIEKYPTNKRQTSRTSNVLPESRDFSITSDTILVTLLNPVIGNIVFNSIRTPFISHPSALDVMESCSNKIEGSRGVGKAIEKGVVTALVVTPAPFKAAPMAPKGIKAFR